MKNSITYFALLFSVIVFAQSGINYKAIIKDSAGNIVANDLIVVNFTIFETSATGTIVYKELHTPNTDANGLVVLNIGEGTPITGIFGAIDWGGDIHFLKTEINTEGSLVDMGTTQFKAVPYALSVPSETININDLADGKANSSTIALGADAGLNNSNTTGTDNTFIGVNAGKTNTSGISNTYIGTDSGSSSNVGTGTDNVSLGANSGSALSTGSGNVTLGANAGASVSTGSGNVIIGASAGNSQNYTNKLIIDNSGAASPLVFGDFQNDRLFINRTNALTPFEAFGVTVNVTGAQYGGMYMETKGDSNSIPFYGFAIDGEGLAWIELDGDSRDLIVDNLSGNFRVRYNTASKPVAGSWIANSDERLKRNIISLDKEEMLQKVLRMKGVSFEWNDHVTTYERPEGTQVGFIAQDLQKIWPEKVSEDHLGYLQTAYGDYDPVIIEAIKALNDKIENQEREINLLKMKVSGMEVDKKESVESKLIDNNSLLPGGRK